jgi:hypothetical protein
MLVVSHSGLYTYFICFLVRDIRIQLLNCDCYLSVVNRSLKVTMGLKVLTEPISVFVTPLSDQFWAHPTAHPKDTGLKQLSEVIADHLRHRNGKIRN